ncbi:MAG: DUF370 domain-containing protein [Chloroflexi bacterium]|nr:DUF370 domain-containing protein [Chloroflexota bacterium]
MDTELIHIGFGNVIAINRIIAIVSPSSAPTKRLVTEAKDKGLIIDMTSGRRTKAVLITDDGHLVLAAISPETVAGRVAASRGTPDRSGQIEVQR